MRSRTVGRRHRRSPAEGAEFRSRLVESARGLFAAEGFESVSIRRIAQRAGCPPMTFYVYFKTKRALLYHIWTDVFADLRAACAAAIEAETSPGERLRRYLLAMIAYWLDHPDSYRLVYMNEDVVESPEEQSFTEMMEGAGQPSDLEALITAGVVQGAFRSLDAQEVAQVLFAASVGVAHVLITIPEAPWRREALISQTCDLLLRGLERSPQPL